jgi:hypothetical protein
MFYCSKITLIGFMGAMLTVFSSHATDLVDKKAEQYYQKLMQKKAPTLTRTIEMKSSYLKTKLSEKEIKEFQNSLKTVMNTLKDIQEKTKSKPSTLVMKSVKTFAFMHYYYGDIMTKPVWSHKALLQQASQIYDKTVFGNEITLEVKNKFVSQIIGQLFREVDMFFYKVLGDSNAKSDKIDFFYPVVEIAGNVIPNLTLQNKSKLVEYLGETFDDKEKLLNRFNEFLEEYYHPEEQVNGLLYRPWLLLTSIIGNLNTIKSEKPELYKELGGRLLTALNQGLACYLSVAGDFLTEGVSIDSMFTETHFSSPTMTKSDEVLITEIDSMQDVSGALGQYLEGQCKRKTGEEDLDECLEKFEKNSEKYQKFCQTLVPNFLSDYLDQMRKKFEGKDIPLETEEKFKSEQATKITEYIKKILLSDLCLPETLHKEDKKQKEGKDLNLKEEIKPIKKEEIVEPNFELKKEFVKPSLKTIQPKPVFQAPLKKEPVVKSIQQPKKEGMVDKTPPLSLKDRIKFYENLGKNKN